MKSILYYTTTFTFLFNLVFTNSFNIDDKYYQFEINKNKIKASTQFNYDELSEKEFYNNLKTKKVGARSLPNIDIQTNSRPVCEECEFNYASEGSTCCDTAWDEFGLNCATLETMYGWDCSGCVCPGDITDPECGDDVCNGDETFDTCPEDCDEPVCGDGVCSGDETFETCPEDCTAPGECNEGFVPDCADEDCCPESWIADGFQDCEDQAYGCDLTCYDNDGGDCIDPECGDNSCNGDETYETCPDDCAEPFCGDGICNGEETDETCPQDCEVPGSDCYESWINDGYCDSMNNNEDCQWDGGDCCGSTCLVSTYDCVGSGEGSYGACFNDCLDPNSQANDDCCVDNTCPFTCEGNGLVTCWDGSCAENSEDCPEATCSDTPCSLYLSSYTCPQIEENYGYDCSICEEEGVCPITCEDEGLITCFSGECAISEDDCNGCENPVEAVEGVNYSEGYDEFYHFDTEGVGGFITLSTAGAGIDTKLYLYPADCDIATTFDDFDSEYIAYNDDWGSSQYGVCPDCDYIYESYIYIGIPAGEYIIVSSDTYNSTNVSFEWSLAFDVGVEGCTNASANNYNPEANIDDGSCEFDDGLFFVTCDGGSYQSEVSWELINNDTGNIVLNGGAPYESIAAIDSGDYVLNAIDSWGDGWNGNIWTLFDAESNEIFSYTLDTGTDGLSEVFTIEETGCYPGDLNNDDILNILDVLALVNAILTDEFNDQVQSCGDMNEDGIINILDILAIVNIILS